MTIPCCRVGDMAQRTDQADEVSYCCSICLDLLKDPVTVPCGHNYCMSCIQSSWDEGDQETSCPQCRKTFTPRPVLVKNTLLAELVEERKKAGHCYAGPGDVACDFCTGRRLKASKSCLQCLASYCEKHLQPHYESPTFKKHTLVEASADLQENVCPRHDEVMKMFCRTDRRCICYLCSVDDHKGHDTVSAAAERAERQQELAGLRQRVQQRTQERQREVELLHQEVEAVDRSADEAVEGGEEIFTELKLQVRSQQRAEVSRVRQLQEELQQEIAELKRKDAEMEKLSGTDDHARFLHSYPTAAQLTEPADSPRPKTNRLQYFEDVRAALKVARDQIQALLPETPSVEPTTRAEFLQCSHHITLDPNSAGWELVLSEENRKVTFNNKDAACSQHPDRFTSRPQVLSRDGLTGRCYWEVEMSSYADVAVAYRSVDRRGVKESLFGWNRKSWALRWFNDYTFIHDKRSLSISGPRSSRVGVYLDHRAGVLAFYSVSETMTLLHRVQTTFTEPLYAGLRLYCYGCTAELCKL